MFKAATIKLKKKFSRKTGRQMGLALIEKLGAQPDACWLFASYQKGLKEFLKGIHTAVGTKNIVGCTTGGEISCAGYSTESAVLAGIVSDQIDFKIAYTNNLSRENEAAGKKLAKALVPNVRFIQLFSDGLSGNGSAILRGMESILGNNVSISGGTSADDGKFLHTLQFAGDKVLTDAAVSIGLSGNFKISSGVRSGWSPIGLAKKVTRAQGNTLYELNNESALKVYERFLGKHAEKLPEVGVEYPLGLAGEWGDVGEPDYHLLRATTSVNRKEGSIRFAGEIPEGAMVRLTCGDSTDILNASKKATRLALANLGKYDPAMVFVYTCMARKIVLGRRIKEEFELLRREMGKRVPIIGFYSYGEYCQIRPGGPNLLHNETVTVSIIGI